MTEDKLIEKPVRGPRRELVRVGFGLVVLLLVLVVYSMWPRKSGRNEDASRETNPVTVTEDPVEPTSAKAPFLDDTAQVVQDSVGKGGGLGGAPGTQVLPVFVPEGESAPSSAGQGASSQPGAGNASGGAAGPGSPSSSGGDGSAGQPVGSGGTSGSEDTRESRYQKALRARPVHRSEVGSVEGVGDSGTPASTASPTPSYSAADRTADEAAAQKEAEAAYGQIGGGEASGPSAAGSASGSVRDKERVDGSRRVEELTTPGRRMVALQGSSRGEYVLDAGTVVPGVLGMAIRSDLPGEIRGIVSRTVYDARQRVPLIPRGTVVIGRYDSQVAVGQNRVLVGFTEIKYRCGPTVRLPGLNIADRQGSTGLQGKVNNHYRTIFGNALALAVISAGFQLAQPPASTGGTQTVSPGQTAASAAATELSNVAAELLRRNTRIEPTLRIGAGQPFLIVLNGDLVLPMEAVQAAEAAVRGDLSYCDRR